ncbi:amidase [Rhodoligotrophos defluvii]|uniref:amidase n=1 Tax=Rhodoligotrophos defluvii TaxID=2561934 RepID=UPI0010C9B0B1|nr:amidase [Rhodoligotrophos defluvii]
MTIIDTSDEILQQSAAAMATKVARRELSPVELVDASLARIAEVNEQLNAFCLVLGDEAREAAKAAERAIMAGERLGPLHGVPIAMKDLTPTRNHRTTSGSRAYRDFIAPDHASIARSLLDAGAILVGKTTTPEFAYSGFTYSPLWGITRNPWDTSRTSGGSSGGSGVAVATACVPLAEGSDMGGSVRIPAACCGVAGLKPSLGRIPFTILRSTFETMAHFGPLARTCDDVALFLAVTQGPDEADILSNPQAIAWPETLACDPRHLKIALSVDLGFYAVDPDVERNTRDMADRLRALGAEVEEISLGWTFDSVLAWDRRWNVYLATHYGHLLEEHRDDLDPEVVRLIEKGNRTTAIDLKRTEFVATDMWEKLAAVLARYDAMICPTLARPVARADQNERSAAGGFDADGRYIGNTMTCPFNLVSQCPVLSVPSGFTADGLPSGLQIVGRRFADLSVLRIGKLIEDSWGGAGFPSPRPDRDQ